ncbi:IS21-like element helper ATPase IstB [Oceanirhabdus sp. W0125-5]|uniref:IS21-like element helper ATPase IstB n=1 Tax=Oceanirhabdus sp. W0125-5 TaxID=2999116 RepID=UPI0022F2AB5E|nr:IS21-like element helper ATPase IstB [Oceanirhabdus sp. W0125-5]WBW94973.1 IS21-like element helper ATPase IstB [Oceanirhabdus sp. W0125-5]WBW95127.1 IS21-like element helper ATPase IstB [Oceanirhabdus sp. W0125-5]WBW95358.1 IS21-like element helper ATPase IstB [Oceanirhabdus sp. W0125-5]WBW95799.1 IS21-like element helper ATPase IstB [Oceanirhabdus sp. W0125-5]WBW98098.1 IS21-like element helper ATPase IstB [Oceanirhabdus sp. W0125-5]
MSNYNKLLNNLETLKLEKFRSFLPNFLDEITNKDLTFIDALLALTEKELEFRNERASRIQIAVSAFPFEKTLSDFDFDFQPSINKTQILDLESLRFIENKENILFFGSSGVGKTHLAVALGVAAAKKRHLTYFISCHDLIMQLNKAHAENRLETKLKHYAKYKLLIIDEIGYLPIDKQGANLLFQLINKRYEKNSTIITTNQPFSKWGEVFSDITLANAILDRLIHHSSIVKITGPSYRLKGKIEVMESKKIKNQ